MLFAFSILFNLVMWTVMIGGYYVLIWLFMALDRRRRRGHFVTGLCPQCRYDLRHAPHMYCPECGNWLTLDWAASGIRS